MATSPIYSWPEPDNTDLVKNGALAIRTLGNAIDTTMGTMTPKSTYTAKGSIAAATAASTPANVAVGANGTVLTADSTAAAGVAWASPAAGMTNPMTTTGDMIYSSPNSTPVRRAIGTTGQILTVSGGVPTWTTPASSSSAVVQVKSFFDNTNNTSSSTTYSDTAITLSITPTSASNKVLVIVSAAIYTLKSGAQTLGNTRLVRGATTLYTDAVLPYIVFGGSGSKEQNMRVTQVYLDSPATTSATTYKLQFAAESGGSIGTNTYSGGSTITLMEVTP
jgi:hypothetical protein